MKSIIKQNDRKAAFTIVELLTVMSIIVILIGLMVPSLNMVRRYAWEVRQKAQFNSIDTAIELFNSEFQGYPDSSYEDPVGVDYCGAMKLCEAMMGRDLLGFHPDSIFMSNGRDGITPPTRELYPEASTVTEDEYNNNISARKGPYLPLESANAYRLDDLYENTVPFDETHFVLCDVYKRVTLRSSGKKAGMPILYYKADTAKTKHNEENPEDPQNIYNYMDNHRLVGLGMPWDPPFEGGDPHRLYMENGQQGVRFYMNTRNDKVTTASRPYRADSYILISAGYDGEYGTPDDICNFEWKYREMQ
jgi:type II secretory pathway pseudopilin PulG